MEWTDPAIVLDRRPYGEADAIATVLTASHGAARGLVRGGLSRGKVAVWQEGNLVQARWAARLDTQLGTLSAELVHPTAAQAMDDPLSLAVLAACCAVATGALVESETQSGLFEPLAGLLIRLPSGPEILADAIRWEATLLAVLGYGLDLTVCAVTGAKEDLAYVSPRTGRAVSRAGAGIWAERLLPLPPLFFRPEAGCAADWRDGLRLTGRFLERDAFGHHHRPLPAARIALYHRACDLAAAEDAANAPIRPCLTI